MELKQLTCFVAVADTLHFGRAAQRLNMLPSALGRQISLLEAELGTQVLNRSTRHVALTAAGVVLLDKAHEILRHAADAVRLVREVAGPASQILRIGAIDSAAAGLLPALLYDFHARYPAIDTRLVESKSAQILPMLAAGRLDLGFVRPPVQQEGIAFEHLFDETPVAVLPQKSRLASRKRLRLQDLADLPLILPPRHTRPHSFGVVMRLFASLGVKPNVVQEAEEKQTIVNLVAAGLGVALLPEWMGRMRVPGVVYRPIDLPDTYAIPEWALGVAWLPDVRCAPRDRFLALVRDRVAAPRRSPPGAP